MGTSTSKTAAKTASKLSSTNTARKYPTRIPATSSRANVNPHPDPQATTTVGPTVHPSPQASQSRDAAINADASDPNLAPNAALNARLQSLGPVHPNPTFSPSPTFTSAPPLHNPANPQTSPQNQNQSRIQTPTSSPLSQHSSHDPSLSTSFTPSPSNPAQSIFPPQPSHATPGARPNPAVSLLTARYRIAEEAEREFASLGRRGGEGRSFLDVVTLRQILVLRDEKGMGGEEIEKRLGLRRGVVGRLGKVVGLAG